jgi:hypothetical protein
LIWKQLNLMQWWSCWRNSKELSGVALPALTGTLEQVCRNWSHIPWRRSTSHPFQYRFSLDTFWSFLINLWFWKTSSIPAIVFCQFALT